MSSGSKYVQGADGHIYEETINPSNLQKEHRKVEAQGVELVNGELLPIRDVAERNRQNDASLDTGSHLDFFKNKKRLHRPIITSSSGMTDVAAGSVRDDRQALRRQQALQEAVETAAMSRPEIGSGPNIRRVSDKDFFEMQKDPEFMSLAKYAHKLTTSSGKVIRPVLAGEVGMYKDKICILEDAEKFYGSGTLNNTDKNS